MKKSNLSSIKKSIKDSNIFGAVFLALMLLIFGVLSAILPKKKQIIFSSFSGRQYSDSPRTIYELLKGDPRFADYKMIWAFTNPSNFPEVPKQNKINIDSLWYYVTLFSSQVWISNASLERLIPVKSKKITYINTWHGVPIKHLGPDEKNLSFLVKFWYRHVCFDLLTASGDYDKGLFKRIFASTNNIKVTGLPRNRELLVLNDEQKRVKCERLMKKYELDFNKPVLLYAPTFREYDSSSQLSVFSDANLKRMAKKYNLLFRGHYFVGNDQSKSYFTDVSDEHNLNDLMELADILVSDYSSIIFDFALLNKPIVLFCYDLKKYLEYRGAYIDPRSLGLPVYQSANEISSKITSQDFELPAYFNTRYNAYFDKEIREIKNVILKGDD